MPEARADAPGLPAPASCGELFRAFQRLALQGFGGVLPVAHRELVERLRWLSPDEFVELLALGQVLPGPNIINLALIFGDRHFGWRGALAATAGLLSAPMLLVLALATLYRQFATEPMVAGALRGMGAVAAGLVLSTAVKLWPTLKKNALGLPLAVGLAAATFAMVGLLRWPMVGVVLGLGSAAMALAWWRLAASEAPT
ncbi:chromate transporter [Ideonella sp. A 288]|uniref:chromate transporter n=1 Tax=Ideonella sp. A 288 TaxID=1962181 RepID=UPI000B4B39CA|nr:chromate transporter [Ideonella sp. A 288]